MASKENTQFRNDIKDALSSGMRDANNQLTDVLGPEISQLAESTRNMGLGLIKSVSSSLGAGGNTEEKRENKKVSLLQSINNYFKRDEKRDARTSTDGKKGKGFGYSALLFLASSFAIAIGSLIGTLILPFQLLAKGMMAVKPVAKMISSFASVLMKIPGVGMLVETITKYSKNISSFVANLSKTTGIMGSLSKGLMIGFKVGSRFLVGIFAVIDFFKGFVNTQGDLIEKIKGGLNSAISGFLELPLKLLGKVLDWSLNLFNIQVSGGIAKAMMDAIKVSVDTAVDLITSPFRTIKKAIANIISFMSGKIYSTTDLMNDVRNIIDTSIQVVKDIYSSITSNIISGITLLKSLYASLNISFIQPILSGVNASIQVVKDIYRSISNSILSGIEMAKSLYSSLNISFIQPLITNTNTAISLIMKPFTLLSNGIDSVISYFTGLDISTDVYGKLKSGVNKSISLIMKPFTLLLNGITDIGNYFTGLEVIKTDVYGKLKSGISTSLDWITYAFGLVDSKITSLVSWFTGNVEGLTGTIDRILGNVKYYTSTLFEWVRFPIVKLNNAIVKTIKWFRDTLSSPDVSFIDKITDLVSSLFKGITDWFLSIIPSPESIIALLKDSVKSMLPTSGFLGKVSQKLFGFDTADNSDKLSKPNSIPTNIKSIGAAKTAVIQRNREVARNEKKNDKAEMKAENIKTLKDMGNIVLLSSHGGNVVNNNVSEIPEDTPTALLGMACAAMH
jgi:phage-related protein